MADVSTDAVGSRFRDRERGQLILVTALGMAILLVVIALVLNTTVYTQHVASREIDSGATRDAIQYRESTRQAVGPIVEFANGHNNTSSDALNAALESGIGSWSRLAARHDASVGRGSNVSIEEVEWGTHIFQSNDSREFTNVDGNETWTLVSGVNRTRQYELSVDRTALVDADENDSTVSDLVSEGVFELEIDDSTDSWRVFVYQDGSEDVLVAVENSSGELSSTCRRTAGDGRVNVSISTGTVEGERCQSLDFMDEVGDEYAISHHRGGNVTGSYSLIVDRPLSEVDISDYGTNPQVTDAIYGVRVDLVYQSPELLYETDLHIVPGDPDE